MAAHILAVDIDGDKVLCGLVDARGNLFAQREETLEQGDWQYTWPAIKRCADALMDDSVIAIGAVAPGPVDDRTGIWINAPYGGRDSEQNSFEGATAPNSNRIEHIPLAALLREHYGLQTLAANNANACALAEMQWGLCADEPDFLWLAVSGSIGAGLVISGTPCVASGFSGAIGHLRVEEDLGLAAACRCGGRGCLDAMASGTAIAAHYAQSTGLYRSAKEVAALAHEGDETAKAVYARAGEYLGRAIAAVINLMNLPLVVLGGGVAVDLDLLLPAIRACATSRLYGPISNSPRLVQTGLGRRARLLGAATVAWQGWHEGRA